MNVTHDSIIGEKVPAAVCEIRTSCKDLDMRTGLMSQNLTIKTFVSKRKKEYLTRIKVACKKMTSTNKILTSRLKKGKHKISHMEENTSLSFFTILNLRNTGQRPTWQTCLGRREQDEMTQGKGKGRLYILTRW